MRMLPIPFHEVVGAAQELRPCGTCNSHMVVIGVSEADSGQLTWDVLVWHIGDCPEWESDCAPRLVLHKGGAQ